MSYLRETKKCPYCAEAILTEAIKCRYCGSDVRIPPGPARPPRPGSSQLEAISPTTNDSQPSTRPSNDDLRRWLSSVGWGAAILMALVWVIIIGYMGVNTISQLQFADPTSLPRPVRVTSTPNSSTTRPTTTVSPIIQATSRAEPYVGSSEGNPHPDVIANDVRSAIRQKLGADISSISLSVQITEQDMLLIKLLDTDALTNQRLNLILEGVMSEIRGKEYISEVILAYYLALPLDEFSADNPNNYYYCSLTQAEMMANAGWVCNYH